MKSGGSYEVRFTGNSTRERRVASATVLRLRLQEGQPHWVRCVRAVPPERLPLSLVRRPARWS
jgi:hypothetical protein